MKEVRINSGAHFKAFQHSDKPIYAGDIIVKEEYGVVVLVQEAMGTINCIAFTPLATRKLIHAIENTLTASPNKNNTHCCYQGQYHSHIR